MSEGKILSKRSVKAQSELSELRASWAQLATIERVERLRALVDKRFSRRAIATGVRRSEGLVRQLLELENLTAEEKQAVREGSLSVRKALGKIHERRIVDRQRQPEKNEQERAKHTELSQPAIEPTAPTAESNEQQSANRTDLIVKAAIDWVSGLGLTGSYLQGFFAELRDGITFLVFAKVKPRPEEVSLEGDPQQVIESSRPKREVPAGPGYASYCVEWYACWCQRLIPDREMRKKVLESVEQHFREKKWLVEPRAFNREEWWASLPW
jgi:hypothetical protein